MLSFEFYDGWMKISGCLVEQVFIIIYATWFLGFLKSDVCFYNLASKPKGNIIIKRLNRLKTHTKYLYQIEFYLKKVLIPNSIRLGPQLINLFYGKNIIMPNPRKKSIILTTFFFSGYEKKIEVVIIFHIFCSF